MAKWWVSERLLRTWQVEAPARVADGRGGWIDTWQHVGQIRAVVAALSAREQVIAQQLQRKVTHRIYVAVRDGVVPRPGWRVAYGDGHLYIIGVYDPDGTGRVLVCEAEAAA